MHVGDLIPDLSNAQNWANDKRENPSHLAKVVYFWSVGCPACHAGQPHLKLVREKYADRGLCIVAVHQPRGESERDANRVRSVMAELQITAPCLLDNDHHVSEAFDLDAVPTYYLFGADGRLKRHAAGGFGVKMMASALEKLFPDA